MVYMFHTIVIDLFGKLILNILCCRCFRKNKGTDRDASEVVMKTDIYKDLSMSELFEFYKRINKEYIKFKEIVTTSHFNKDMISLEKCKVFLSRLEQRISNVEISIDSHLACLIRVSSRNKSKAKLTDAQVVQSSKFSKYSYPKKL